MNKTGICKKAVAYCRLDTTITNVDTDDTPVTKACLLVYDDALQECLEAAPWTFASRTRALATHTEAAPADWLYRYEWPPGCLKANQVLLSGRSRGSARLAYRAELNNDGTERTILSDTDGLVLRYTWRMEDTNKFTALFGKALVYLIASELAALLKNDEKLSMKNQEKYVRTIFSAATADANTVYEGDLAQSLPDAVR